MKIRKLFIAALTTGALTFAGGCDQLPGEESEESSEEEEGSGAPSFDELEEEGITDAQFADPDSDFESIEAAPASELEGESGQVAVLLATLFRLESESSNNLHLSDDSSETVTSETETTSGSTTSGTAETSTTSESTETGNEGDGPDPRACLTDATFSANGDTIIMRGVLDATDCMAQQIDSNSDQPLNTEAAVIRYSNSLQCDDADFSSFDGLTEAELTDGAEDLCGDTIKRYNQLNMEVYTTTSAGPAGLLNITLKTIHSQNGGELDTYCTYQKNSDYSVTIVGDCTRKHAFYVLVNGEIQDGNGQDDTPEARFYATTMTDVTISPFYSRPVSGSATFKIGKWEGTLTFSEESTTWEASSGSSSASGTLTNTQVSIDQ